MEKLHVGVVVNPSKLKDVAEFRGRVVSHVFNVDPDAQVSFYETTVEDAGFGQAQQAVSDGCSVVLAAGGDGTVRLVAAGLAHSDVALGIIPMGTGNLFARNLDIPIDNLRGAIKVALTGEALTADLGYLQHGESLEDASDAKEEPFLVIAGFGFDAVVMENTNSKLKKAVGWLAYVVAGAKKIVGRGQSVDLELDGRSAKSLKARTVMIGNVGRLPGGITLMPGADRSNGSLEILALDWKGAAGFSQILGQLVLPGGPKTLAKISNHRTFQAREAVVSTSKALPVQVDGDYVGNATHLVTRVDAGALLIRCAR
ncbi:diacylglycerol kinase family protein [Dermabacter hominis]|uniref:diacylglycerol/lipid kinase family protein n=1 Tax=Dermabacter TaxID=36739 RepID=UPI0003536CDC|nr:MULTISPECIES: diacylglycerol kinase family protein [Dermabacter]EPH17744.1 hypothetical protein HMPREF1484_00436 [Dermabacter sp. HFH0086]MDK8803771.1 diacylglycerol kinase family protein [Dermabacter hominis]MDU4923866.1 diacylglycerol kinase family protein [Dermabacter sp.]MDU5961605.1 diacylglycerol kinase family protein [Dermabacter sp.]